MSNYRWKITQDYIDADDLEQSAVGVEGPYGLDETLMTNPTSFSMYDDDQECYYEGMIYGDFTGFEPLDDFGTPNAGCSMIKIDGHLL
jgi:hypothetical protein